MNDEMMIQRIPIKLKPEPVERVWGGVAARRAFGWAPPEGKTIGEWWVLSFRHDHPSWISEGEFEGHPLPQLIHAQPELLGENVEPALLIKILDSAQSLSVQVHPDDKLAKEMGLDSGKTECWCYLDSEPGAFIYCGIKDGVSSKEFFDIAENSPTPSAMDHAMEKVHVKEGALSFISAGTVHAIGQGVFLMEVQQNSDTTFRIYDWGRPREVHIKEARMAVDNSNPEPFRINDGQEAGVLVECDKFVVDRFRFEKDGTIPSTGETYSSITCLAGKGEIKCESYHSPFNKGDTWFIPAECPALLVNGSDESVWIVSSQKIK